MIGRTGRTGVERSAVLAMLVALVALIAAACGSTATPAPSASSASGAPSGLAGSAAPSDTSAPVTLKVLASASFTDALTAVKTAYEAATPGVTLDLTFAATEALAVQIQGGLAADVFIADDMDVASGLVDGGFTTGGDAIAIAGDSLALIVPAKNPAKLAKPSDLVKAGVKIVGVAKDAPLTAFVGTLLGALASTKGYPAGFVAAVTKNVVSREATDRAALAQIVAGQGDAAFVYTSDVAAAAPDSLKELPIPAELNLPTTCGGVALRTSSNADAADDFLAWLGGADGLAVLTKSGFVASPQ